MKYYSEVLNKMFDDDKELVKAEEEHQKAIQEKEEKEKKLADERKARADEVEEAFKAVAEAQEKARKLLNEFCKDYGAYHRSYKAGEKIPSLFDWMFRDWLI
jgi:hypothetical protein